MANVLVGAGAWVPIMVNSVEWVENVGGTGGPPWQLSSALHKGGTFYFGLGWVLIMTHRQLIWNSDQELWGANDESTIQLHWNVFGMPLVEDVEDVARQDDTVPFQLEI